MENILEINSLDKSYQKKEKVLNAITFNVPKHSFFALLGLNGAGKTTLINILSGLCYRDSGSVKLFGLDIDHHALEIRKRMGMMPQEFNLLPFVTVKETLLYHLGYYGLSYASYKDWMGNILKHLDLERKLDTQVFKLSGGMKRRLMMARALVTRPSLALLDEPTAGVDIDVRHNIYNFLKEINKEGTTIILTTHYLEEANELCNNYVLMSGGKVVREGLIADIRENTPLTFQLTFQAIPGHLTLPSGLERIDAQRIDVTSDRDDLMYFFNYFKDHEMKILQISQKSQLESYFLRHAGRQNGEQ